MERTGIRSAMANSAPPPVGLIVGGGDFPSYLLAALKQRGYEVVVVAVKGRPL